MIKKKNNFQTLPEICTPGALSGAPDPHTPTIRAVNLTLAMLVGRSGTSLWFKMFTFLMTKDIEHFFICLLATLISSFLKCLFKSFAHFYIELFVFLL